LRTGETPGRRARDHNARKRKDKWGEKAHDIWSRVDGGPLKTRSQAAMASLNQKKTDLKSAWRGHTINARQ